MNSIGKFKKLRDISGNGIWAKRILAELEFALEVSKAFNGAYKEILDCAISKLWDYVQENGAIVKEIVIEIENDLSCMQQAIKEYTVLLVGHAHIDMNWMWGYQETAAVTVDTFETILQLMEEYPQFKFSQSQASVYAIIEKYYPELLEKIRKCVKEGRWEVTASTWVENDKNMSGSESMARHILYTKNYLSKLLEIPIDSLCIDFEPDTFGHNENMPEILTQGGVKYYYHCRGFDKEHIYRWQAPSGAEVLVYREPVWYNAEVLYDSLSYVPSFCKEHGLKTALKMYGVGDHGGGPTRRDLQRWLEMQEWPLMPVIKFGTLREFYAELEKIRENLPIVKQELNFIFTGCYTSQSRIKKANKYGEDRLFDAETLDVIAHHYGEHYKTPSSFENSWRKILFNQFHDILPGSGTVETREFGMGEFQKSLAGVQINLTHAMRSLCASIDTEGLITEEEPDRAFGAGAGFGSHEEDGYLCGFVGRSGGKRRIVHVFNTTQYPRCEVVKITLWDWNGNPKLLKAYDLEGNEVKCQTSERGTHYWDHTYYTVSLDAKVGAFGYNTYVIDEGEEEEIGIVWRDLSTSEKNIPEIQDPRIDYFSDKPLVMENEKIRAEFSVETMKLISLYNKVQGKELLSEPAGYFREIIENNQYKMTSWRVGNYASVLDINENSVVRIKHVEQGKLVKKIAYRITKETYSIDVEVVLEEHSDVLDYHMEIDWHEIGNEAKGVPQLNFMVPLGYEVASYACMVPFGVIYRKTESHDVPCIGVMGGVPVNEEDYGIIVMSDCKYGFRGFDNSIALTLIRSSYDPDELPEQGRHLIKVGVGVGRISSKNVTEMYERYTHPMYSCCNSAHKGTLPGNHSFLQVEGDVKVIALKMSEDKKDMIIRMHNLCAEEQTVILRINEGTVCEGYYTDVLERNQESLSVSGDEVMALFPGKAIRTIRIKM